MDEMQLSDDDLVTNPTPRVPVCLCLDVSGSMAGAPIEELREGVQQFFAAVHADEVARHSVEVSIVTFGPPRLALDFAAIDDQTPPQLSAGGETPMGAAVLLGLDALERRKAEYRAAGVDYFQPWFVLMTDGRPTDLIDAAASRAAGLVDAKKLTVFPIGIGPGADLATLARFSPSRAPLRLQGLKFSDFFLWLSRSVARVSQSIPGQAVPLPAPSGWSAV